MPVAADAPTITDWIQTVANSLSLMVSAGALTATGILVRHELHKRRQEVAQQLTAQALMITSRVVRLQRAEVGPDASRFTVDWQVRNDSESPISRLRVAVIPTWDDAARLEVLMTAMGEEVLAPGEVHVGTTTIVAGRPDGFRAWLYRSDKPLRPSAYVNISVEFVDILGHWWHRIDNSRPRNARDEFAITTRVRFRRAM